jgi:hypothetical protein
MAQPTNTFDSYETVGIREDLSDVIYSVSPEETPFLSTCKKVKAANTYHEWQEDALRSSADNKHIEGDDTAASARAATTRRGNYTQIFKDAVVIPDTDEGLNKAGRGKEMAFQIMKVGKEQKLDIERALHLNNARVAGNASTARELAGVPSWLTTSIEAVSGGTEPTGDGTDARVAGTTPTAFTQVKLDDLLKKIWDAGGKPDTVYISSFQMNVALGFTGSNNQRNTVDASSGKVSKLFDVYMTPFGAVKLVPSREIPSANVFVCQSDMWAVANLRGMKQTPLAKTGDATKRQVICELTLESRNEAASGMVTDNTTS